MKTNVCLILVSIMENVTWMACPICVIVQEPGKEQTVKVNEKYLDFMISCKW